MPHNPTTLTCLAWSQSLLWRLGIASSPSSRPRGSPCLTSPKRRRGELSWELMSEVRSPAPVEP
eukprot:5550169-Pyramimonas_sp.AAC.1